MSRLTARARTSPVPLLRTTEGLVDHRAPSLVTPVQIERLAAKINTLALYDKTHCMAGMAQHGMEARGGCRLRLIYHRSFMNPW
jgi:hypothetical protein